MALGDYKPESREFKLKGGEFSVYGLSLETVASIINTHLPEAEHLFDVAQNALGKTEASNPSEIISALDEEGSLDRVVLAVVNEMPAFAASVTALASGEDDYLAAVNAASKLPFPVQIEVLKAVVELTFSEVGGVKKAVESITGLLRMLGWKKNQEVTTGQ